MKLDADDIAILKLLTEDGRASLREVAARASLSTPTVSLRLSRMKKGGLIKGFAPVIDPASSHEVLGLVKLRVNPRDVQGVASRIARMPEVRSVFVTTGGDNVTVKVAADDIGGVRDAVNRRLLSLARVDLISTEIVTAVIKDDHEVKLKPDTVLKLRCDYCGGEVSSDRPYNIRVGSTHHYFCCRTCRRSFLEENRSRIARAAARARK